MELEVREFPLQTQIGYFENEQDVDEWLLKKGDPFDYGYLIKASQVIYTPQVQEYLIRYRMQKQFNIYSYSQNFDEIPADWIDVLAWIETCSNEALREKQRLSNGRQ